MGVAAGLHGGLDGRVLRPDGEASRPGSPGSCTARRSGTRCRSCARRSPSATRSATTPTSPTACVPVPGAGLGRGVRPDASREVINPRPIDRPRSSARSTSTPSASSPTPKGATTTSTRSSGAAWAGTPTPTARDAAPIQPLLHRRALADGFAQGLLALERNWRGPLAGNAGVDTTLEAVPGDGDAAPRRATC